MSNEPFGYVFESFCLPECADDFEWIEFFQRANPVNGNHVRNIIPVYTQPIDDTALLRQALDALEKSRVFVTTREKVKHPEGTEWYDDSITALRERLGEKT